MAPLGQFRDRVTIQRPVETADDQGGWTVTWSTLADVWAAVRPRPRAGGESFQAGAVRALTAYEVEIVYRADVSPRMRLRWTPYRGAVKTLEIGEVTLSGRDRVILQCTEA
jgi:SPP1 family predicted phage head-tail adaptor